MTIETSDNTSGPYTGTGALDTYAYDFPISKEAHLRVIETTDAGVMSVLVLNTDYTVTGVGEDTGGNVVRTAGNLPTDYTWFILRDPSPFLQETDFDNQGNYYPENHENSFDTLTAITQYIQLILDNCIKLDKDVDHSGFDTVLPEPIADYILQINSAGTGFDLVAGVAGIQGAQGHSGLRYLFNTTTADADHQQGDLWFDNATPSSVTTLYIDFGSEDGANAGAWINSWDDADSAITGTILIKSMENPNKFVVFHVTGAVTQATGYRKVAVTHVVSEGTFNDNEELSIEFSRTGDDGADGVGAGDFLADGSVTMTGNMNLGGFNIINIAKLLLDEKASAAAAVAAKGEFWVKSDTPNVPMFTDDAGTDFQLGAASVAPTLQVFASAGSFTYTPTTGMKSCLAIVTGGGGGGGGADAATTKSNSENSAGGGGGAGGTAIKMLTASDIGVSKAVTIGAAGTAGGATGTNGGTGGTVSLATTGVAVSSTGGGGGAGGTAAADAAVAGGAGGVGSGGDLNLTGGGGGGGLQLIDQAGAVVPSNILATLTGGIGGSSFWGGGAAGNSDDAVGSAGNAHGSGGSGGVEDDITGRAGGAGKVGAVFILEFF